MADRSTECDLAVSRDDQGKGMVGMVKPQHDYKIVRRPSDDRLLSAHKLTIGTRTMGDLLGIPWQKV